MKIVIDLSDKYTITKSGANEGFIRKAPKRLKNQIDKVKQSKKDRNRMQKKIENAYEINKRNAENFKRSENRTKTKIISEKYNFAGKIMNKVQKRHLKLHGLDSFLEKYPQFA